MSTIAGSADNHDKRIGNYIIEKNTRDFCRKNSQPPQTVKRLHTI